LPGGESIRKHKQFARHISAFFEPLEQELVLVVKDGKSAYVTTVAP
jgi:hypothetical protein